MKKLILSTAIIATAAVVSLPANSATQSGSVTAGGTVGAVTTLDTTGLTPNPVIDLSSSAAQSLGTFTTFSNVVGTYSTTVTSPDNFDLVNAATGETVPYSVTMLLNGTASIYNALSATAPIDVNITGSADIATLNGFVSLAIASGDVVTSADRVAGSYSTTVVVEMTAP